MSSDVPDIRDWSDPLINPHPFTTCPVCDGLVEEVSYHPLVKACTQCEKSWHIRLPLTFRTQANNQADALAYALHEDGLSWTAVSIILRTYHNVELGNTAWRRRIDERYLKRRRIR